MDWISLGERLPDEGQKCLITNGDMVTAAEANYMFSDEIFPAWSGCEFDGYDWEWDFDRKSITHWAELPIPPIKVSNH